MHLVSFIVRKFVTMHGNRNVKFLQLLCLVDLNFGLRLTL